MLLPVKSVIGEISSSSSLHPLIEKPVERIELNLDEVRHLQYCRNFAERAASRIGNRTLWGSLYLNHHASFPLCDIQTQNNLGLVVLSG